MSVSFNIKLMKFISDKYGILDNAVVDFVTDCIDRKLLLLTGNKDKFRDEGAVVKSKKLHLVRK